jgi:hypothetical protein
MAADGDEYMSTPSTAAWDTFALLIHAGAKLDTNAFRDPFFRHSFSSQTLHFLLDNTHRLSIDWFVNSEFLSSIVSRKILRYWKYTCDEVIFLVKSTLSRERPTHTRSSSTYSEELRRALSRALTWAPPNMELIKILFYAGATPQISYITQAVMRNQVEVVEFLLSAGALPDTQCLLHAILGKHVEIAKLLLCVGATPDDSCLAAAVAHDNTETVKILIFSGARPNTNCLSIAIGEERWGHVETLISAGSIPDSKCLSRAVRHMNIEVVKALLSARATPNAHCLWTACSSGMVELVELLLSAGVKPDA